MSYFTRVLVNQNIVTVTITETNHVPDHAPYSVRLYEVDTRFIPQVRSQKMLRKPGCEYRLDIFFYFSPNLGMSLTHVKLHGLFLDILHVSFYVSSLPLFGDYRLKRTRILDPFNQASVATQRHNAISPQAKASLTSFRVRFEHSVAENREVYKALLLTEVTLLITFQQKVVNLLVSS